VAMSGWVVMINDFGGRGRPMLNNYIMAASLFLNIMLNIFYIPKFGIIGAAWASTFSYCLAFLITLVAYSKVSDNKIRDIIFLKKEDFLIYKNLLAEFAKKSKIWIKR
jgi:Na+-driven multidrug efflux pump